jgi:hypothetical protein
MLGEGAGGGGGRPGAAVLPVSHANGPASAWAGGGRVARFAR